VPTFDPILIPLDGSDLAEQAIPYAEEIARREHARVVLLRAVPPLGAFLSRTSTGGPAVLGSPYATEVETDVAMRAYRSEQEAAAAYLDLVAQRLQSSGISTDIRVVEGEATEAILEAGRDAGLIAMSTHGRGGLGRVVMGSTTDEVLRREPNVPMLIVRHHQVEAA
jgi:nucleotide-binding universal stress UspA family protein